MADFEEITLKRSDLVNLYNMAKEMPGKTQWNEQLLEKIYAILYPPPPKCRATYGLVTNETKWIINCELTEAHPGKHRFEW